MSSAASLIRIQQRIAELTRSLKSYSYEQDPETYSREWDERADLVTTLAELNGKPKSPLGERMARVGEEKV